MKLLMASIGFLFLGICTPGAAAAAEAISIKGIKYEHKMETSRFNVGEGVYEELEGPYRRVVGDKGVFMVDTVTGATLAVPTFTPRPVPKGAQAGVSYPQALTDNPDEHSVAVRKYLGAAGVPAAEVGGTHVTATMAGSGPISAGVQSSQSKLLWYTTHLDRSLNGIPVEGSYAFAALDSAGKAITEGVYWPAIPSIVVAEAKTLKKKLGSASERDDFLARVKAARPDAGDAVGEVKIVHTAAGYHGTFEAKAVYSVVVHSPIGGKAQILRFDSTGTPVLMADEQPNLNAQDSVKRQ